MADRAHASTEGATEFLKPSVAGFLVQKLFFHIITYLLLFTIVGGSEVSTKIGVIESLLEKVVPANGIPDSWMGLDFGPVSIKNSASPWTVPRLSYGMDPWNNLRSIPAIAKNWLICAQRGVTTIIVGGDSVAVVEKAGLADKISRISIGGSANLELLEGKDLMRSRKLSFGFLE